MKEKIYGYTYRIEENFIFTVVRRGLTMMIPFVLIGGIACALVNLPFVDYSSAFVQDNFKWLLILLNSVYEGTFGIFSLAMVIAFSISYAMERNELADKTAMYVIVSLGAYGAQLNIGTEYFNIESIGTKGSFSAIFVSLLSCYLFDKLRKASLFSLKRYTMGMESLCANAVASFIPMVLIVAGAMGINRLLEIFFGVHGVQELFSHIVCGFFDNMTTSFGAGILYTIMLHLLWALGFHGSHVLEPVAQTTFANATGDAIFSKSFFDIYIVMGGCGTTICAFLVLLLFYRKDRLGNIAKLSVPTVIFNMNEVLNFGIPIILNPIMVIPFVLTPIVSYCISYFATAIGLVPQLVQEIPWSTPILMSGYLATDSIRGVILQIVCVGIGMCIYYPFIKMHKYMNDRYTKEKIGVLVDELVKTQEENEQPRFITRADSLGLISRMLVEDLRVAIKKDKLYLLYQPQVDGNGKCIGAEALLRWKHSSYGLIYPPLIIYLAKEGGMLPDLERKIFDMACASIKRVREEYGGDFKISVNITAKSLLWDLESCIEEKMKKYGIDAKNLWIEITEQDVLTNSNLVFDKLRRLDAKGHTLLIDDFGMGHTSLMYLQHDFFRVVKLDGSLVRNITENKTNEKIVASVVELGNELNIKIIAEYVEIEQQRDKLYELGCCWYQGYYYSKPVEFEEFVAYMKQCNKQEEQLEKVTEDI